MSAPKVLTAAHVAGSMWTVEGTPFTVPDGADVRSTVLQELDAKAVKRPYDVEIRVSRSVVVKLHMNKNGARVPARGSDHAEEAKLWIAAPPLSQPESESAETPWRDAKTEKRPLWWFVLRGLVVVVAIVILVAAFRQCGSGQTQSPSPTQPTALFPEGQARMVAALYVETFYTWDADSPKLRAQALDGLLPADVTNTYAASWDGKGHQVASDAHAIRVSAPQDGVAQVTVLFRLSTTDAAGAVQPTMWAQAVVPVSTAGDQVVIEGAPGLVPVDVPAASTRKPSDADGPLTSQTRDYVTSFFTTFAAQKDASAVAAPGSQITGLGGQATLAQVSSWTVWPGGDSTRDATAIVTWQLGAAQITDEYTLTLTKTTGGGGSKWLVSAVHGTTNSTAQ